MVLPQDISEILKVEKMTKAQKRSAEGLMHLPVNMMGLCGTI